jgi:hemin uptake protein HemP
MNADFDENKLEISRGTSPISKAGERRIPVIENRIDSSELFVGGREITIAHGKDIYRLRLTAQNKLILTK